MDLALNNLQRLLYHKTQPTNWIVWNSTDYSHKMDLALNNLQRLIRYKNPTNQPTNQRYILYAIFFFNLKFHKSLVLNKRDNSVRTMKTF